MQPCSQPWYGLIDCVNGMSGESLRLMIVRAGWTMLRLPLEVAPLFRDWLAVHYPLRAAHVMSIVRQIRGGRDNEPRFHVRMGGQGEFADLIRKRYAIACKRLGLNTHRDPPLDTTQFKPPSAARVSPASATRADSDAGQLDLFS